MQDNIRAIVPISIASIEPNVPPTGMPIFELVKPTDLFVDPTYQRDVSDRGLRQIRRIIEHFDWTKYKPPICSYAEHDGKTILKVLDGQHTAIGAASNPHVDKIPVMIVEAEDTIAQAKAFIGQNSDRLGVTHLQMHQAAIAAADEDAQTLELTCTRANIKMLKSPNSYAGDGSRQTIAVKTIEALIARRGPVLAREILEIIANADRGPITAPQIKAVEYLMTDANYAGTFSPDDMTLAIVELLYTAEEEARLLSGSHKIPFWRALALTWYPKCKKRRNNVIRVA
ncbi:DUF6551 family protein [Neorhizobium galegae]|uniref:DUF6551 family protein n=1 Tax=Neorhizobium galegae TaxID=399 RepID=UPI000622A889|nr:DUF6551 family protein [Neorhizobium galegae]CDZ50435.1 Hypothetical protein NGAL_HAMBI2427_36530 [Neorhizobium galegae bv. orientalis]